MHVLSFVVWGIVETELLFISFSFNDIYTDFFLYTMLKCTVEPPNKGHIGGSIYKFSCFVISSVLCREASIFSLEGPLLVVQLS